MSVIVRDPRDNKIKLYCKGADEVMYMLLESTSRARDWDIVETHLSKFATKGLRTLVAGFREVSPKELSQILSDVHFASQSLDNRADQLAAVAERAERGFRVLGATAIEDKLQPGVPETLSKMQAAGLKVWVLTGDKVETAINIARSANLITERMFSAGLITISISYI
eukprot:316095_1